MSSRKRRRSGKGEVPDSEPEVAAAPPRVDRPEADLVVGDVMRFVLFQHTKRLPSKMSDIRSVIKKRMPVEDVMSMARQRFDAVFGYELTEVPLTGAKRAAATAKAAAKAPSSSSKRKKKTPSSDLFILVNAASYAPPAEDLEEEPINLLKETSRNSTDLPLQGLLVTILALIQLSNGSCKESKLWRLLDRLNIRKTTTFFEHGTVQNLLHKTFTSQLYVEKHREQEPGEQEAEYVFKCGSRAMVEFKPADLFTFISKAVMGEESVNQNALHHFVKQAGGDMPPVAAK